MSSTSFLLATAVVACCAVPATAQAATLAVSDGSTSTASAPKGGGHISLVDTTTGRVKSLVRGTGPAFSADGKRLVYATSKGLRILVLATGRGRTLTTAEGDHDPVFSRDSKSVLFNRAPDIDPTPQRRCYPPGPDGVVPPCDPVIVADYIAPDDIYRVPAAGGDARRVGNGCYPSPAPVGRAIVSLGRAGFGIGCGGGSAYVNGDPPPGSTRCAGRTLTDSSQAGYLRRATWIGRAGGILMAYGRGLMLASMSATPRCDLIRLNETSTVRDAAPSPGGRSVAMLYSHGSKTGIDVISIAKGKSHTVLASLDIAATHIAWRPKG